ncbi:class II fructose-bisphosphate aldolase [Staphylococcus lutrae]|uniref:6-phospho-5-dehydro-2-deoxy-D-gluconate aldolase n=1 Tax=Staphylococcus lutrae TaxID=155085 RepID=A0AAC9RS45_9STAP|nr:ketose-bisphosphate aldolase [Staphylococcus lutrae]ARJ50711.1 6-phospho-5-dehydro-2-deoxy-D-gluconate aldolase [Staphylococcus lutrae]PNZ34759.1 ketose-bisphosphate aldolase [Staphylococcus lutrae]
MKVAIEKAYRAHYAIPQINVNGLIWIEGILRAAEKKRSPIILGTTDKLIDDLGGYSFINQLIRLKAESLKITIPYYVHLDHGRSVESCYSAIDAGYDSVMYDGSQLALKDNIHHTQRVVDYAHQRGVCVEGEIGAIGGNEDGMIHQVAYASVSDCIALVEETHLDSLAPALGSVHGPYKGEPKLGFDMMQRINQKLKMPLVLHGASGLSNDDLSRAIQYGHSKINFNTEINLEWSHALRAILTNQPDLYQPKAILNPTIQVIQKTVEKIIDQCGSSFKA